MNLYNLLDNSACHTRNDVEGYEVVSAKFAAAALEAAPAKTDSNPTESVRLRENLNAFSIRLICCHAFEALYESLLMLPAALVLICGVLGAMCLDGVVVHIALLHLYVNRLGNKTSVTAKCEAG